MIGRLLVKGWIRPLADIKADVTGDRAAGIGYCVIGLEVDE
jgi:hypothetical protein